MSVTIGSVVFEVSVDEAGLGLLLSAEGRPAIRVLENGPGAPGLKDGRVPDATLAFLAEFLGTEAAALDAARQATAALLWDEYAGSWREAGDTDLRDVGAFAQALGAAEMSVFVDEDGSVSMVELHWADRALFLGHSVFTQVYEPEVWQSFDATIFG